MTNTITQTELITTDPSSRRRGRGDAGGRGWRTRGSATVFHVLAIAVLVVILYPAAWMVMSSFKPGNEIIGSVSLVPETFSLDNYATAFAGIGGVSFWTFVVNSLILAVASVVGVVLSCSVTAYAFARIRFRGSKVFFLCMIATMLLPFHVVIIPQYIVFNQLDMINTYWPLLLGKFLAADAFFVFLMIQFIRGLPRDLDEAARIDGAGHARIFFTIILRLVAPILAVVGLLSFIGTVNEYVIASVILIEPEQQTLVVGLTKLVANPRYADWSAFSAGAVMAAIPVMILFLFLQKYIVGGLTAGATKG